MSVKEKAVRIVTQMKSTSIVVAAFLIIAAFALISMPQMIPSVNAQSEEASEHACPVPGYTLSGGECTDEPIIESRCEPSTLNDVPVILDDDNTCSATRSPAQITEEVCNSVDGQLTVFVGEKGKLFATCIFAPTETITCPGGVPPTEEGECITKPGRGNDPT